MVSNVFPGQGSQFQGMSSDLDLEDSFIKEKVEESNSILGFDIFEIMTNGSIEDLRKTNVTQPAIFLHSIFTFYKVKNTPVSVAGHSLGEFSALVANGVLSFTDGLSLVKARANAMQKACEQNPGTMAAVLGMTNEDVEKVCADTEGIVVPANYNSPGQLVISGELGAVEKASELAKERGAKRAIMLPVGGAFHSPLMEPARKELAAMIEKITFKKTDVPVYQNVTGLPTTSTDVIRENLLSQLTGPVKWTQSVQNMIADGVTSFIEVGPGKALKGLISKIDRTIEVTSALAK